MAIFSIMVLLVTVGGVAALLRRYVFIPLRLLADFTEKTIKGVEQEIPSCGTEIETLAGNIRSLVGELNSLRQEKARWKKEE